ncbi:hypothetical protein CPLU01_12139 [Colletotrichum plurivorum]|uniref:Uncharacterized protein n=1 Tax=Colletotrichum plurivorum TaxID=2175906 RepID=A0A8H6K0W3_9PEZI|nr:hypothetical protein CPLU01_12139 [Colletotrichum plurivorum]
MHRDVFAPWCGGQDAALTDSRHRAVHYVKKRIMERFGVDDPSDAFVVFPDELGGLGLVNPFFSFFANRQHRAHYEDDKKAFDKERPASRAERVQELRWFEASEVVKPEEMNVFLDFQEWKTHRETTNDDLAYLYRDLFDKRATSKRAGREPRLSREFKASLYSLPAMADVTKAEMLWLIQMYWDEVHEKFGGPHLVDRQSLPLGVLAVMAGKPVRWGMVL